MCHSFKLARRRHTRLLDPLSWRRIQDMFVLWPMPLEVIAPKSCVRGSLTPMKHLFGCILLLFAITGTSSASAQTDGRSDLSKPLLPVRLEAHGSLTWEGFLGFGFRADIPIVQGGLVSSGRDELAVSVGSDFILLAFTGSNPLEIWPTVTLQWTLTVDDHFVFYPELGVAASIDRNGWQGVFPNVGFGARYYLWRSVSLMGRFGWPMAISLGATF